MTDWRKDVVRQRLSEGVSWDTLIDQYQDKYPGVSRERVRSRLYDIVSWAKKKTPRAAPQKIVAPVEEEEKASNGFDKGKYEYDRLITICDTDDITDEVMLKLHHLDTSKWDVVTYKNNFWHSQVKGGKRLIMYQSKITVKPKKEAITLDDIKQWFETTDFNFTKPLVIPQHYDPSGETLEIDVADLHSGLYSWMAETGANYDVKIAREFFMRGIVDVISRCEGRKFKKIILALLGDLLHTDNDQQTTTKGTFQQVDGRMPQVFTKTLETLIEAIDLLAIIAPVDVLYTRGNHDYLTGWTLIKSLEMAYRKDEKVSVDVSPDTQKDRLIGCSLVGFVHGNMPKKNLSGWLQVRARQMRISIKYMEVHSGHNHTEETKEIQQTKTQEGVVVRTMPAICNGSTWEHNEGYSGATQAVVCFIWDDKRGLRETWYCNM